MQQQARDAANLRLRLWKEAVTREGRGQKLPTGVTDPHEEGGGAEEEEASKEDDGQLWAENDGRDERLEVLQTGAADEERQDVLHHNVEDARLYAHLQGAAEMGRQDVMQQRSRC